MNRELSVEQVRYFFEDNKNFIFPIVGILTSFLLFLSIIIPQVRSFSEKQALRREEVSKLNKLKENLSLLSALDEKTLDSQVEIATSILPPDKNFESVLSALSLAATSSNVTLGEYEFQLGDISGTSKETKRFPVLQFDLNVNGSPQNTVDFVNELYKTFPLSEAATIKSNESTSLVTVIFYFKPIPPVGFNDRAKIKAVSPQGISLLTSISKWNRPESITAPPISVATESGEFSSSPF